MGITVKKSSLPEGLGSLDAFDGGSLGSMDDCSSCLGSGPSSSTSSNSSSTPGTMEAVSTMYSSEADDEYGVPVSDKKKAAEENNHGVLALQQAAVAAEKERNALCIPAPFRIWFKPQQPLWLDMKTNNFNYMLDNDNNLGNNEGDEEDNVYCHGHAFTSFWGKNNKTDSTKDKRKGMLLWTPKKHSNATSFSCNSSKTNHSISSSSTWFATADELEYTNQEMALSSVEPTEVSDLTQLRHVWIVTTATLPWMTGTAVNPLLRAAALWQRYKELADARYEYRDDALSTASPEFTITLVLPWLYREKDRLALYGADWKEKTVQHQEAYIRQWLTDRAKLPQAAQHLRIQWYSAHYHPTMCSIFAVEDVCDACLNVPDKAVVVLEEPEHLNFYRVPGKASWKQRFAHVIGIVHTNYRAYAQAHASGLVAGPLIGALVSSLVRAYCDKVIKLSDALQNYAPEKEVTVNVHGIREEFLQVPLPTSNKVYFIGKLLWAKGLDKMLSLQSHYKKITGEYFPLDIFGSGPEKKEIARAFLGCRHSRKKFIASETTSFDDEEEFLDRNSQAPKSSMGKMPVQFLGCLDHAAISTDYRIFVNPSITEVLCTTTAEALAMGKFVIIPHHPSNSFFSQFPNCLQYHNKYEFCVLLKYALTHNPTLLSNTLRHTLTWDAATDRFLKASAISQRDAARRERISGRDSDERFANFHEDFCKGTSGVVVRTILHGDDEEKKSPQYSWFPKYL